MHRTHIALAAAGLTAVVVVFAQPAQPVPAASMPTSASQPAEVEIRWDTIGSEVAESLHDADLCRRASEAAAQPMPTDVRELFRRLNLFLRAGYGAPARATIAALGAARIHVRDPERESVSWSWHQVEARHPVSTPWVSSGCLAEIVRGLLADRDFELAQFFLEAFPQGGCENAPALIDHWEQSGWPQERIDRWLADRAAAWPWGWVPGRAGFLARHKSAEPLLRSLADGVRAAPEDGIRAMVYLEALVAAYDGAVRAAESPERPDGAESPEPPRPPEPDWMGEVCRPASALALRELGYALSATAATGASRKLFELALATKLSSDELDWLTSLRQQYCSWRQAELEFQLDVLEQLATREKELGDTGTAERHAREAETRQAELDQLLLEKRIRSLAEVYGQPAASAPATSNARQPAGIDEAYRCLARAKEHAKRGEHDAAVQSFEAALNIAPQYIGHRVKDFDVRSEVIRGYAEYLLRAQGLDRAQACLRKEIAEAPRDSESAETAVSLLTSSEFARGLDAHDDVLWSYLEKTSYWDYAEKRLMTILLQALPQSEREARWSQLEDLAREKPLSRAATCGRVLLHEGAPERAIPHLERAVFETGQRWYDASAASDLCSAYLKINDWRRAEGLFRAREGPGPGGVDAILLAAAREGAFDDALRLWRRRANFDLRDLKMLPELAQLGMREQLRAFYRELATKCPDSWVPARALALLDDSPAP